MARNTIERFDAEGNVIAMTDAELDALDAKRRRLLLVFGVIGLIAAIVIALALSMFLKVGWQGRTALDDVSQFSNSDPTQINAKTLEYRLDQASGFDWGLSTWGLGFGRGPMDGSLEDGLDQISPEARLPVDAEVTSIYTNLANPQSVRENGRLLIVRFARNSPAREFLMAEPTVFVNPAVEELRDTYWSGAAVIFYSPTGAEEDRTYQIRKFLPEFAACPKNTKVCVPGSDLTEFDDWAPRAPLSKD